MRLGISTASFFGRTPTESCFDVLRQLRVDTTEVFLNTFFEYEKPYVENLAARKGSVNVHSVHALTNQFEPELFSRSERIRNDAEITFRKVCYAGHVLGAKYYTFHGPLLLKRYARVEDYQGFGERLNQIIAVADSYGLKLAYENVHYAYFNEPAFFTNVLEYCPDLYATLDIKQALQSEIDVYAYMNAMGDRIATVHVCDYQKKATCLPGQGKFNFERLFRELDKRGCTAPVLMELYSKDYADLNDIKESYNYLLNCMKQ